MNTARSTNYQLFNLCKRLNIPLMDICSKNKLRYPIDGAYIINMQDDDDGNGTHWVALWLNTDNNSEKHAYYFDSFGLAPPLAVLEFCKQFGCKHITSSTKQVQSINSGYCGAYCVNFLHNMSNVKHNTYAAYEKAYMKHLSKYN